MNTKWTKPYLIILTIVTVIAVIVGVYINVISRFGMFGFDTVMISDSDENASETKEFDISAISSIDAELKACNISIVAGDGFSVSYEMPKALAPEISTDDNTLSIVQKDGIKIGPKALKDKYNMVVTIPADAEFENVSLDIDMGNVQISNIDLTKNLSIDADMGNVGLSDVNLSGELDLDIDMGNVDIINLECESVVADVDMGNINAEAIHVLSVEATDDMGNIEMSGYMENATVECSMGNINIKTDNESAKITAKTDAGDCKVNGVTMHK